MNPIKKSHVFWFIFELEYWFSDIAGCKLNIGMLKIHLWINL